MKEVPSINSGMEVWEKIVSAILISSVIFGTIAATTIEILAARAALIAVTLAVPVIGWIVGIVGTVVSTLWTLKNHISLWTRIGC